MSAPKSIAACLLTALLAAGSVLAQAGPDQDRHGRSGSGGGPPSRPQFDRRPGPRPQSVAQNGAPASSPTGPNAAGSSGSRGAQGFGPHVGGAPAGGPRTGEWLRRHQDLPPAQQEQALRNDPNFKNLPPEGQQRLLNRLKDFNSRPPEQRERMLERMRRFDELPPDQQQRARGMFNQFRSLPDERKMMVNRAFHRLQTLPPEERQRAIDSPAFRNNFNDQEREILRGMSELNLGPGGSPVPRPPAAGSGQGVPRPPQ